ncbi:uncharacterized protein LOC111887849 [Lactuca sativa]|uniref:uncharacterized protein LOC111887849 n=1 Tax=Lactuca sativa TaxID=4236 RepID=UPI000CB376AB|nr:uncharacterized protein LOC111887849 [Lactuca sativa]
MASINRSLLITLISIYLGATIIALKFHDILPIYGLPKGILPNAVQSYYIIPTDGTFSVQLTRPCFVTFGVQIVFYNMNIIGRLSNGSVSVVSGIEEKESLSWMSVSGMDMESGSDMLVFNVTGGLRKKFPAALFKDVPDCDSEAYTHESESHSQSI